MSSSETASDVVRETPFHPRRTSKIAVIGAGSVGATMAYAMLMRGSARTVVLYDINRAKVEAEALDLAHGIQFMPMATVAGSDDIEIVRDADVVIFTAGAKQKPGQTRLDLAGATIALIAKVLPRLVEVAPDAVQLIVTNPVDVVTYVALKVSGLPANQVFGSGTLLDTSRLRYLVSQHTGIAVQNVHAYIAGEHGDSQLALWSSATLGAVPLLDWPGIEGRGPLTQAVRDRICDQVKHSAATIIAGKGATNYAVGLAGSRIIEAILNDEHRIQPVSSLLDDYRGISDVCLSVPSVVGSRGVGERLVVPMSSGETTALHASAVAVREVARQFGY
ncbi:MAG: L-lactate dehydrogenase [Micrococcales bacterium]|nr:L-lactate dehydrogenase [Micrococcales bacterium]